jgi:hypothetical protein
MRDYGKVHSTFWTSDTTRNMSEDARWLAFYLLSSPHGTIAGVFRLPDGYACEDLQWGSERVSKGFHELAEKGFAKRCETTKWVWVIKHFDWNPPENPNQKKAAAKMAAQIPSDCFWKADFLRACWESLGYEQAPEDKPLINPYETVSKPVAVAVAVAGTETGTVSKHANACLSADKSADPPVQSETKPERLPPCPHKEIITLWGKHLPHLTQPRIWEGARLDAMRSRWTQAAKPSSFNESGYSTTQGGITWWDSFFAYIATTKLAKGFENNGRHWKPDLEWVLKQANFQKIIDGRYEK